MNKKLNHLLALVMVLLCTAGMVTAQVTVNHPFAGNSGTFFTGPVTTINYYDNGGQFGNYSPNSSSGVVSFAPNAGGKIQAVFSIFQTETSFDALYCYDGPTTASPKIASANGVPIGGSPWGAGGFWSSANSPAAAPSNVAPGTVRATPANASGRLTFAFRSDGSVQYQGWAAVVSEFTPCNPIAGPALSVGLNPGVCVADVNVTLPASYSPAGCINDAANNLRYFLDANPPVNIPKPLPASITINNVPSGTHTITWQVYTGTGSVVGEAIQNLEVNDTEPPVLDCPSDIIVNLDPGLCCAYVSWGEVTATDNCPFIGPAMQLLQTCTYTNYWTGYAVDLQNLTSDPMNISAVQIQAGLAGAPAGLKNLRVYMRAGTQNGNVGSNVGWTEVANTKINVTAGFPTQLLFDIPFTTNYTIPGNSVSGLYVVVNNGSGTSVRVVANVNNTAPTSDGMLSIVQNPSTWVNGLFGGPAFNENPRPWLQVDYQLGGDAVVVQTGGPMSGDELCKDDSPWTVSYEVVDVAGNVGTCEFNIEVLEYANPTTKLTCNDNVQISLDEDCVTEVGADDVLEGGPYGCYDDYVVTIYKCQQHTIGFQPECGPSADRWNMESEGDRS